MLFFFLALYALSDDVTNKICICEGSCPNDSCKNADQVLVSKSTNLDDEFNKIKTAKMEVLFTSSISPFSFSLSTFTGTTVSFNSIAESASIKVNVDNEIAANVSFSSLSINFHLSNSLSTLKASSLSLKGSSIQISGSSSCKISTGSLYIDYKSIQPFSDISITGAKEFSKNPFLMYDITSDYDSQVSLSESSLTITCNSKSHKFLFTSSDYNSAKINTSSQNQKLTIFKSGFSYNLDLSLDGFADIEFLEGSWSSTDVISLSNTKSNIIVNSLSSIIPISVSVQSQNATIIVSQQNSQISGNISASTTIFNTTYSSARVKIEILGEFNSKAYLTTSYIDLTIDTFAKTGYSFDYPFTFTIGKEGVSSIIVKNSKTTETLSYSSVYFVLEFDHYLGDAELSKLIEKNLTLLDINGVSSYSNPSAVFLNENNFIHGFNERDCLVEINRVTSYSNTKLSIYVHSPDNTPLTMCVGSCFLSDGPSISEDELKDLTTKYFVPGIKKLILNIQTPLQEIPLNNFAPEQKDLDIQIVGTSYLDDSISEIDFGDDKKINEHIVNLTLKELTLGGDLFINVKNVTIINCEDRDDTAISFLSGVNVTGNDMFITELASKTTGSITNFTFLMDHYETITFLDDGYTFEDRESNLGASTVPYSLFEKLNIVYDVGTRYSSTKTNVYLIAQTNQTPDISLSFSLFEYKYERRAQLVFQNWSSTKNPGAIDFYHYEFPVNIVLTEPYLPKTFKVYGTGEVTYITNYTDSLQICAYQTSDTECPSDTQKVPFDQIKTFIPERAEDNITVFIVGSDESNHLIINLATLDNKQIKFTSGTSNKQYLDFDNTDLDVDKKYTSSFFDNLVIGVDSSAKPEFLWFGGLQFTNCDFSEEMKDVTLNIDDFITDYATLYKFKNIVITDNLVVSGDLIDSEKTITFTPDENSEDLKATISESTTITLGEGYVKIGKIKFQIEKSQNFDIILIPNNIDYLEFKYEQSDATKVPLVRIQEAKYMTFNFTGTWPSITISQKYIVSIGKLDKVTIYLSSENVPLECEYISGDFNVTALSENVGITGSLKFDPQYNTEIVFGYDSSKLNNCKITLKGGVFFDSNFEVQLLQPNLELYIPTVHKNETSKTNNPSIQFVYYIGNEGSSLARVGSLDNVKISKDWEIKFEMTGNLDDEKVKKFISEETVLLVTTSSVIPTIEVSSFHFSTNIHGINKDTFEIAADLKNNKIVLRNIVSPFTIPFELCYGSYMDCEIKLDSTTIDSFSELLPASDQLTLQFVFHDSPKNHILNFDVSKFNKLNVTIKSQTFSSGYSINCKFGQDKISDLYVNSMNVTATDSFKIENVYLSNKGILLPPTDINGIKNLNIDFSSYSFDLFQTFPNNLTINFNKDLFYTITFNSDGWTIAGSNQFNDTFKKTDFPNLCFNLSGTTRPTFNVAEGINTVQNVHIISNHKNFMIGPNWNKVTGPELDIILTQKFDNIKVETLSFPFRPFSKSLMKANYVQFSEDILPLTIKDTLTFNNEHYNISFYNLIDQDKERIYIDEIIFKGDSELVFEDVNFDSMPAKIQRATVDESSIGSITAGEVMSVLQIKENGTFVVSDVFEADEAIVKFNWNLNKMPRLNHLYPASYWPKGVEINFEGDSISGHENDYNNFLYQRSYSFISGISQQICQNWLNNLTFNSKVNYFSNGNDLVLNASCNNGNLMIVGRKLIPSSISPSSSSSSFEPSISYSMSPSSSTDEDSDGDSDSNHKKKMKTIGIVVGVVVAVVVIAASAITAYFVLRRRRWGHAILNEEPLNDINSDQNPSYAI